MNEYNKIVKKFNNCNDLDWTTKDCFLKFMALNDTSYEAICALSMGVIMARSYSNNIINQVIMSDLCEKLHWDIIATGIIVFIDTNFIQWIHHYNRSIIKKALISPECNLVRGLLINDKLDILDWLLENGYEIEYHYGMIKDISAKSMKWWILRKIQCGDYIDDHSAKLLCQNDIELIKLAIHNGYKIKHMTEVTIYVFQECMNKSVLWWLEYCKEQNHDINYDLGNLHSENLSSLLDSVPTAPVFENYFNQNNSYKLNDRILKLSIEQTNNWDCNRILFNNICYIKDSNKREEMFVHLSEHYNFITHVNPYRTSSNETKQIYELAKKYMVPFEITNGILDDYKNVNSEGCGELYNLIMAEGYAIIV